MRQTKWIWDEVHARLKKEARLLPRSIAGEREATWIIADYLDVVLHVFTPEAREYYRLEELWDDVPHEVRSKQPRPSLRQRSPGGATISPRGAIAQLGERLHGMQEVAGSIPAGSIEPSSSERARIR